MASQTEIYDATKEAVVGALGVGAGAYFILTSSPKSGQTALVTDVGATGAGLRMMRTF